METLAFVSGAHADVCDFGILESTGKVAGMQQQVHVRSMEKIMKI